MRVLKKSRFGRAAWLVLSLGWRSAVAGRVAVRRPERPGEAHGSRQRQSGFSLGRGGRAVVRRLRVSLRGPAPTTAGVSGTQTAHPSGGGGRGRRRDAAASVSALRGAVGRLLLSGAPATAPTTPRASSTPR